MIIMGYPCIGKSSVALEDKEYIDLESSHFKVDGRDNTGWEKGYCDLALALSRQDYTVFTSTHLEVQKKFLDLQLGDEERILICYPILELKDQWIQRVEDRYTRSALYKDFLALKRTREHYEDDIKALMNSPFPKVLIKDIRFDLRTILPWD